MSHADRIGSTIVAALLVTALVATNAVAPASVQAQESSYRLIDGWAQLPNGVTRGARPSGSSSMATVISGSFIGVSRRAATTGAKTWPLF